MLCWNVDEFGETNVPGEHAIRTAHCAEINGQFRFYRNNFTKTAIQIANGDVFCRDCSIGSNAPAYFTDAYFAIVG